MNRFWAGRSWPDIRRVLHAERGDLTFGAPSPSGGLPAPAAHLGNRETLQLVRRMRNSDDARDPLEQEADAAAARAAATGAAGALDGLVGTVVRDDPASRAAVDAAGARAVTLHGEIWLGSGESARDVALMSHELAHVRQQRDGRTRAAQAKKTASDAPRQPRGYELLTTEELQLRHDELLRSLDAPSPTPDIVDAGDLGAGNESPRGTRAREYSSTAPAVRAEVEAIAVVLARRHGVFSDEDIALMKDVFVRNMERPKSERLACTPVMNAALRTLYHREKWKLAGDTDEIARILQAEGLATPSRRFDFLDERGRLDRSGSTKPVKLENSLWMAILEMAAGDVGWVVFGMSLLDNTHAVTLSLDKRDPAAPMLFWSDWLVKSGWQDVTGTKLDQFVEAITAKWWEKFPAGTGTDPAHTSHKSPTVFLWRIVPNGVPPGR